MWHKFTMQVERYPRDYQEGKIMPRFTADNFQKWRLLINTYTNYERMEMGV